MFLRMKMSPAKKNIKNYKSPVEGKQYERLLHPSKLNYFETAANATLLITHENYEAFM